MRGQVVQVSRDACYCGVDALATCARCGERRCGNHYVVSAAFHSGTDATLQYPTGSVYVALPKSWGEIRIRAYLGGGPGCVRCRNAVADDATAAARNDIDAIAATSQPERFSILLQRISAVPQQELGSVLVRAVRDEATNRELLDFTISLEKTKTGWRKSKTVASVNVVARTPIHWLTVTGLRMDGSIVILGQPDLAEAMRTGRAVQAVVTSGTLPTLTYFEASRNGGWTDSFDGESVRMDGAIGVYSGFDLNHGHAHHMLTELAGRTFT